MGHETGGDNGYSRAVFAFGLRYERILHEGRARLTRLIGSATRLPLTASSPSADASPTPAAVRPDRETPGRRAARLGVGRGRLDGSAMVAALLERH